MPEIRVVHCKRDHFDTYIGRGSKWGNPFTYKSNTTAPYRVTSLEEALEAYEAWIIVQRYLMKDICTLRDKILGCWCAPKGGLTLDDPLICHGQILGKLAE